MDARCCCQRPSGSGKSTLCAALLFSGWRLLSDELALISPDAGDLLPLPRPVSLKNASIDVIRRFAPQVEFGSRVEETAKGVVAHFPPPASAVRASAQRASPGWVVFPKYVAGAPLRLEPLARSRAFMQLIENAFNYDIFGREGFDLLGSVVDRSLCYSLEYGESRLDIHEDALASGDRALIVDDLLATGGTALAAAKLVELLGGVVAGFAFVIELEALAGRERLQKYAVSSLISYA